MDFDIVITKDELESAHKNANFSWIHNTLDNMEKYSSYKTRDILICKCMGKVIKDQNNELVRKYIVVHIDDHGLVYVKSIQNNKKLSKTMICINAVSNKELYFEIDPSIVESILLDDKESYDPLRELKSVLKVKNKIKRHNAKLKYSNEEAEEIYFNLDKYKQHVFHYYNHYSGYKQCTIERQLKKAISSTWLTSSTVTKNIEIIAFSVISPITNKADIWFSVGSGDKDVFLMRFCRDFYKEKPMEYQK